MTRGFLQPFLAGALFANSLSLLGNVSTINYALQIAFSLGLAGVSFLSLTMSRGSQR